MGINFIVGRILWIGIFQLHHVAITDLYDAILNIDEPASILLDVLPLFV